MRAEPRTQSKSLGSLLVEAKLVSEEQWQRALETQGLSHSRAERALIQQGLITEQQLAFFTSLYLGIPYVNLNQQEISPEALEMIPEHLARKYNLVPISVKDGTLVVAVEDPRNLQAIEDVAAVTRKRIELVLGTHQEVQETLDRHYRVSGEIEKQLSQISPQQSALTGAGGRVSAEAIAQAPVVRALDLLINQAIRDRASDIHIEPQDDRVRVRFRIDGILHEMMALPLHVHSPLVSRVKIMAGMNIAELRRPQDGQISFKAPDREVDIRAATSPTIHGEQVVLRILDKTFAFRPLAQLGMLPDTLETYNKILKTPFGMLLVSGPTGSGKTTTLYASINQMDSVTRNVITIEDPVEYRFDNINQIQVNVAAGLTFAQGLRACMRLDPNVILVGEIRDPETAQIAVQAALTGHLVLSSVHANDSASVVFRLLDLGAEPFLVAASIIGITAQRMVRQICTHCAQMTVIGSEERMAYEDEMQETKEEFLVGRGCNLCAGTGYSGRIGIYEVLILSETMRRVILNTGSADDIKKVALDEGMHTLWHDGMVKVEMGITTPSEVIRNVYTAG